IPTPARSTLFPYTTLFRSYKREVFLEKLNSVVGWSSHSVVEYGCGPGGNLIFLSQHDIVSLKGIDISQAMLDLARKNSAGLKCPLELILTDGKQIPLATDSVDVVFTSTVLQHNVDDDTVNTIISELCRVSSDVVLLCEHTESNRKLLHNHFVGRTMLYYQGQVSGHGYYLESVHYLDIQVSYYVMGAIRKLFNSRSRKEGEALSRISLRLQKMVSGITRRLDRYLPM